MDEKKKLAHRVELNYAACQSAYWIGFSAISGFVAVYLTYRGLSDTEIGLTTAFGSALAIMLQLVLSNVMDRHPELPIKKLIAVLAMVSILAGACTGFLKLPVALMILSFAVCYATGVSNSGYLNAQFVQLNNAGIPARYGIPRAAGSLFYAIAAYVYGALVEKYNPDVLIIGSIVGTLVCIAFVMMMPEPHTGKEAREMMKDRHVTSYREMIMGNRPLVVLLACTLLNGIGNTASYTFIMRVVERVGGSTMEYGISEFVRAAAEVPMLIASAVLLRRFKVKSLLAVAFLCFGLRALVLAVAQDIGVVYLASVMNITCVGISSFAAVMFVNRVVKDTETVRGQSLCALCGSIGSIIGSAYAGAMIDMVGLQAMLLTSASFCVLAFLGMVFLCQPEKATF